jgi:putative endonuclease
MLEDMTITSVSTDQPLNRQEIGAFGEELACRFLTEKGFEVLTRNWRPHTEHVRGELDIVARDGNSLVFCEVKTRTSQIMGSPFHAIDGRKVGALRKLAAAWLSGQDQRFEAVRIDAIGVRLELDATRRRVVTARVEHLMAVA